MLEGLDFTHFLLQPMDKARLRPRTMSARPSHIAWPTPNGGLSMQTHKLLGLR